MNNPTEKRQFDRFGYQKSVRVFPILPSASGNIYEVQKHSFEALAHDISEGGMRMESFKTFGSEIFLKVNIEVAKNKLVEILGKVIWSGKETCGVRFVIADPEIKKDIRLLASKGN